MAEPESKTLPHDLEKSPPADDKHDEIPQPHENMEILETTEAEELESSTGIPASETT